MLLPGLVISALPIYRAGIGSTVNDTTRELAGHWMIRRSLPGSVPERLIQILKQVLGILQTNG